MSKSYLFLCTLCISLLHFSSFSSASASPSSSITFSDSTISLVFDSNSLSLIQLSESAAAAPSPSPRLNSSASITTPLWSLDLLLPNTTTPTSITATSAVCVKRIATLVTQQQLLLSFLSCALDSAPSTPLIDVTATITLTNSSTASLTLSLTPLTPLSLWSYSSTLGGISLDYLSENNGYGILHTCPCDSYTVDYPQSTMQYIASYTTMSTNAGVYVAAHDGNAHSKTFAVLMDSDSNGKQMHVSISAQPINAGRSMTVGLAWTAAFPFVIGVFRGDW